ncbi:MAG: sigma-70 family RNA polymerase sigma factor [Deltaproteobacteria bacterium]|nr:sigma-70 family RNA polymerase sigma factor [Deltaproteobacteria bacterium]
MFDKLFNSEKKRQEQELRREAASHIDVLYGAALRLTKNARDAEDLVQDTYARAFRFEERYEPGTNLRAWLFRILYNTFINRYRRRTREKELLADIEKHSLQDAIVSDDALYALAHPEEDYLSRLVSAEVLTALEALPEEYRTVVMFADVYEMSYKEIAEIAGCPVGTVMSRLFRGRQKLKQALFDYAVEQGIIKSNHADTENTKSNVVAIKRAKGGVR